MSKAEIYQRIVDHGIVAIIRAESSAQLVRAAEALLAGGVTTMEVTMTTPNALEVVAQVVARFGDEILMGVGSVLDADTAGEAIAAGAEFIVMPVTKPGVIQVCHRYDKPIAAGALTPTEALSAHEYGADFIKIFPADAGGPAYIRNLLAPLPMLRILPTGGVTPETAGEFLRAGCVALGAGSALVSEDILASADWPKLTKRAIQFVRAVQQARSGR
jgi:2-dehydro-3-deoxyphosphogluconate aldolase/(4S)-4-hydroxy-2-oxoglutarate aldolase